MAEVVGITKVTRRGTITLPSELREVLDINADDYLFVINLGGLIVLQRVEKPPTEEIAAVLKSRIDEVLKGVKGTPEQITAEVRRLRRELRG